MLRPTHPPLRFAGSPPAWLTWVLAHPRNEPDPFYKSFRIRATRAALAPIPIGATARMNVKSYLLFRRPESLNCRRDKPRPGRGRIWQMGYRRWWSREVPSSHLSYPIFTAAWRPLVRADRTSNHKPKTNCPKDKSGGHRLQPTGCRKAHPPVFPPPVAFRPGRSAVAALTSKK